VGEHVGLADQPVTLLLSPEGQVHQHWRGRSNPARLGLTLRWVFGRFGVD
jgi:hypothetical protein